MSEFEHDILFSLVQGYGLSTSLEGEWVFGAVEPGEQLDIVTPVMEGRGHALLKESGLGEALWGQLENFIQERIAKEKPLARDGIVRFGHNALELIWLPDASSAAAAQVRRNPKAVLVVLVEALRAAATGQWHAVRYGWELPGQVLPVPTPFAVAAAEGQRLGFEVEQHEQPSGSWLIWHHTNALGGVIRSPLAMLEITSLAALEEVLAALGEQVADYLSITLVLEKNEDPDLYLAELDHQLVSLGRALPACLLCVWQASAQCVVFHQRPMTAASRVASLA